MILTCPACQTRYQADETKFPPQGRTVRCARCGEIWHQLPPEPELQPEPEPEPEAYEIPPPPPPPPAYQPAYQPEPQRTDYYTRPSVRDFEPQVEEEEEREVRQPATRTRPAWSRRVALGAGWAALGVLVVVIGVAAVQYRQQIVQVWPQSASLYSKLGMKVNAIGLELVNVTSRQDAQDGQIVLTVSGGLTNITDHELAVPQIRVALVDGDKRELYHWTFAPDVMTLRPGQTTHFVTRLSSPPEGARNLNVRFARAGE